MSCALAALLLLDAHPPRAYMHPCTYASTHACTCECTSMHTGALAALLLLDAYPPRAAFDGWSAQRIARRCGCDHVEAGQYKHEAVHDRYTYACMRACTCTWM